MTEKWFCERGDFWGTINQLCLCAKCGKSEIKRYDEPRHYGGLFTSKLHLLCDECFDAQVGTHPQGGASLEAPAPLSDAVAEGTDAPLSLSQSITPPEGGELVGKLRKAFCDGVAWEKYGVNPFEKAVAESIAALSTPEASDGQPPKEWIDAAKEACERVYQKLEAANQASNTKGLVDALEWIRNYAIKLRRGTDDWFDLVEIELFAANALAQHRRSTL